MAWLLAAACSVPLLDSCGSLQVRPLSASPSGYDCFGDDAGSKPLLSGIEEELHRSGALGTKRIKLASGIGMIDKTVALYISNKTRYTLVFHFMHAIDLEIKDYRFRAKDDSGTLASGSLSLDSRTTIGNMTEEYLYSDFPEAGIRAIADRGNVAFVIGDLPFALPYACREVFRDALGKI